MLSRASGLVCPFPLPWLACPQPPPRSLNPVPLPMSPLPHCPACREAASLWRRDGALQAGGDHARGGRRELPQRAAGAERAGVMGVAAERRARRCCGAAVCPPYPVALLTELHSKPSAGAPRSQAVVFAGSHDKFGFQSAFVYATLSCGAMPLFLSLVNLVSCALAGSEVCV